MGFHQLDNSLTSASLLLRVGRSPTDEAAWAEFVARYGPKVSAWCRVWGLQPADADDITQTVLTQLARQMGRFTYNAQGSFRGWLRTLARNAWLDWSAQRSQRPAAQGGPAGEARLASLAARDDLVRRLEEAFDLEVLVEAVHRVRGQVAEKTWDAYRMTALDEIPGPEVAARLGMTVAAVYKARSNVLKRIKDEVRALEDGPANPGAT